MHKVARILHKNADAVNGLCYNSRTMPKYLETVEVETAPKPTASILWLHGLGADGHDFEPLVPEIVRRGERPWRFVFPHAPVRPVTLNNGYAMRAWYDIKSLDRDAGEDEPGFKQTDQSIRALIAREVERGVPTNRVVLAGFSQGGAASLYTAPRFEQKLAGVMALSCYLPLAGALATERQPANNATPIFMAHGSEDPMVSMQLGLKSKEFLTTLGYTIEWHDYPMPHSVCGEEIADIRAFLSRVLT
jgi:phospholipase/carboxylesterase